MSACSRTPRFLCVAALVCFASWPAALWAHARVLRSEPGDKQVVNVPPATARLCFNELLDRGFHTAEVFPAEDLRQKQRRNLVGGTPVVNPSDRTELQVPLQPLHPGKYVVERRVLSRDSHTAPGRISFEVRPID